MQQQNRFTARTLSLSLSFSLSCVQTVNAPVGQIGYSLKFMKLVFKKILIKFLVAILELDWCLIDDAANAVRELNSI